MPTAINSSNDNIPQTATASRGRRRKPETELEPPPPKKPARNAGKEQALSGEPLKIVVQYYTIEATGGKKVPVLKKELSAASYDELMRVIIEHGMAFAIGYERFVRNKVKFVSFTEDERKSMTLETASMSTCFVFDPLKKQKPVPLDQLDVRTVENKQGAAGDHEYVAQCGSKDRRQLNDPHHRGVPVRSSQRCSTGSDQGIVGRQD